MDKSLQILIKDSIAGREPAQRALYLKYRVNWYMQCLRYGKNKFEADDMLQEGLIHLCWFSMGLFFFQDMGMLGCYFVFWWWVPFYFFKHISI